MNNNLRINALYMENFKSWYGQHKINLDTNGGFMAIVGANGSGKSNIIDALLFVFGWRAKQLRQGKLQDLIHYSEFKPEFAKVTVEFVGPANFSIGRRVSRNGASTYEIDGKQVTLDTLTQMLLQYNLDINHNRFLILQGEVESISMMKPMGDDVLTQLTLQQTMNMQLLSQIKDQQVVDFDAEFSALDTSTLNHQQQDLYKKIHPILELPTSETGLLEFIETVIGTQHYIIPTALQSAKVEYLGEYRNKARTFIQSAISERDAMNDAKEDSVNKIKKTVEGLVNSMTDQMFISSDNRQRYHLLLEGRNQKEEEIEQLNQGQQQQFEAQIALIEQDLSRCQKELSTIVSQEEQVSQQIKDCKTKIKIQQDNQKELQNEGQAALIQKQSCEQQIGLLTEAIRVNPQQQTKAQQDITEIEQSIAAQQVKIADQQMKNQKDDDLASQLKQKIQTLEQEMAPISNQRVTAQTEYKQAEKQNEQKLKHVQDLGLETAALLMQLMSKATIQNPQLMKLSKQQEENERKIKQFNIQALQQDKQQLYEQQQYKLGEVQNLDLKLKDIQHTRIEFAKNNQLLSKLLEAQSQNQLGGIYGRLGSLGVVNSNLNTAGIAAAGQQLDYIVCQNIDCIKACLKFIRQYDLGYANFIDLEQVTNKFRQSSSQSQIDMDFVSQNNGYLFLDMIQTNDQIKPAFWHVFRQLVVTENVGDAININRGKGKGSKIRVVTTTGEIFESSGALVGGNIGSILSRYQGFVKSTNMTEEDTSTLEKQKIQTSGELDKIEQKLDVTVTKIKEFYQLSESLSSLADDIQMIKMKQQTTLSEVKLIIDKILKVEDDMTLNICSGYLKEELKRDIQYISDAILRQKDSLLDNVEYIQQFANFYQQEKVNTVLEFSQLLGTNYFDNLQNTFLSGILHFKSGLQNIFKTQQSVNLQQQIQMLEEQEQSIQSLIEQQKTKLNSIDGIKQYNILRKELQNLQTQLQQQSTILKQLQVDEKRYLPQMERLQLNINESISKIQETEQQINNIITQIQSLQQQQNLMEETIKSNSSHQRQLRIQLNEKEEQRKQIETELLNLNNMLNQLKEELLKNKEDSEQCMIKIDSSEQVIYLLLGNLEEFMKILLLVEEQIQFQQPLFNNHENLQELHEYDIYVVNNFQQSSRKRIEPLKNILISFPQEILILKDYNSKVQKLQQAQQNYQSIQNIYTQVSDELQDLKDKRQNEFMQAFNEINSKLREIYRIFSMGGDATIDLINPFDPFDGLQYTVMPPKKAWRPIQNLSGGEKTLSSLSLIFSLHQYKQNYIYVVDEIDAALDFRNVSLVANYLKEQANSCQFVIISLRNNTFEVADKLIGVYKTGNCSHVVEVDL